MTSISTIRRKLVPREYYSIFLLKDYNLSDMRSCNKNNLIAFTLSFREIYGYLEAEEMTKLRPVNLL